MKKDKILILCLDNNEKIDKRIVNLINEFQGIIYVVSNDGTTSSINKPLDALIAYPTITDTNGVVSAVKSHLKKFSCKPGELDITVCGTMDLIYTSVYCIALKGAFSGCVVRFYSQTCPDFGSPEAKAGLVVCSKLKIVLQTYD